MEDVVSWIVLFIIVLLVFLAAKFILKLKCLFTSLITVAVIAAGGVLIYLIFIR